MVSKAWATANRQKRRDACRKWRANHPERNAEIKAVSRARPEAKIKDRDSQRRRLSDPVKKARKNDLWRQWARLHPEEVRSRNTKAKARRHAAAGKHSAREWKTLLASYHGMCVYCGGEATERDHVIPLTSGGSNDIENIAPACHPCNYSKRAKPLLVWLAIRRRP